MTETTILVRKPGRESGIRRTDQTEVAVASGLSGTIVVPPGFPNFTVGFQNMSATTTVAINVVTGGYSFIVAEDLDGNTYPRTSYTGQTTETFVARTADGYGVVASFDAGITGTLVFQAFNS